MLFRISAGKDQGTTLQINKCFIFRFRIFVSPLSIRMRIQLAKPSAEFFTDEGIFR